MTVYSATPPKSLQIHAGLHESTHLGAQAPSWARHRSQPNLHLTCAGPATPPPVTNPAALQPCASPTVLLPLVGPTTLQPLTTRPPFKRKRKGALPADIAMEDEANATSNRKRENALAAEATMEDETETASKRKREGALTGTLPCPSV